MNTKIILLEETENCYYKELICPECNCGLLEVISKEEITKEDEIIVFDIKDRYNLGPETYGYSLDCHCGDENYRKLTIIPPNLDPTQGWFNIEDLEFVDISDYEEINIYCPNCNNADDLEFIKEGFEYEPINLYCPNCKCYTEID